MTLDNYWEIYRFADIWLSPPSSGLSSGQLAPWLVKSFLNGFVGFDIPISVQSLPSLPGMAILLAGINPLDALITSQVILSFAYLRRSFLMIISNQAAIMGRFKIVFLRI